MSHNFYLGLGVSWNSDLQAANSLLDRTRDTSEVVPSGFTALDLIYFTSRYRLLQQVFANRVACPVRGANM